MIYYILLASSVSSFAAALCCALIGGKLLKHYSKPLTLFAVGFLISLSVSHIIPEAMEMADTHRIGLVILGAMLALTAFEMLISSGQSHDHNNSQKSSIYGILAGSAMHMLTLGLNPKKAFVVNAVALFGCVTGGLCGYFILSTAQSLVPYALALSGASFIYVSLSDLLPRLRPSENKRKSAMQFTFMVLGVALALLIASHD